MATRLRVRRSTSSKTASLGSGTSNRPRAIGRAADITRRSHEKTFSSHQLATSGNDSSRSVSPVGAQSTTIASNSRVLVVALDLEQREQLVHPGRHGQLLGRDAVHAALGEQVAEPLLHGVPVALHLLLGLHLLAPNRFGPIGVGSPPELRLERVGERVGRVRREHHGAQAGVRAAAGGGGGHARLADAALARVEDGPRGHESAHGIRASTAATSLTPVSSSPLPAQLTCSRASTPAPGLRCRRPHGPSWVVPRRARRKLPLGPPSVKERRRRRWPVAPGVKLSPPGPRVAGKRLGAAYGPVADREIAQEVSSTWCSRSTRSPVL